ncbi:MAG: hypothetical protein ACFFGZ_14110 [Candidatus Thorarchaeota archaeon]
MTEESSPSEKQVLNQLKTSISKFIERIGQEVQQLHQAVEAIQREIQSSQAKTNMQITQLSSRLSNLENAMEGVKTPSDTATRIDVLPEKQPAIIPAQDVAPRLSTPVVSSPTLDIPIQKQPSADLMASVPSEISEEASTPTEGEKKEEKRELLKALQLIDSL